MDMKFEGRKSYLDIIDGHNLGQLAIKYPKVGVIVCSDIDYQTMKPLIKNELVIIPQHHCNFDREINTREGITKMGAIGELGAFEKFPGQLEKDLKDTNIS